MSSIDTASSARSEDRDRSTPAAPVLWFGFLAAPVAWVVHLVAASALVPVACEIDSVLVLHLATVVTAAVAIAGAIVARRNRPAEQAPNGYVSFLSISGFWLALLFLALIVLEGLPVFVLEPCG